MISSSAIGLVFVSVLALIFPAVADATVCNNSPALCSRTYNSIIHLGAHDSPFVRNESNGYSLSGDQFFPTLTQLDGGVRLLTAQVHSFTTSEGSTEWHLCHTNCLLYDAGTLTAWLQSIKAWLDAHQSDVVTILLVNSDNADAATLDEQFAASSGIKEYAYTPPSTTQALETWPTLGQMISAGTRLVAFIASLDPSTNTVAPYLLDEFTFVFETAYNHTDVSSFSCVPDRPSSVAGNTDLALSTSLLSLVNHFLYDNLGDGIEITAVENITTTNSASTTLAGSLGLEADQCTTAYGNKIPTFLLVDFFNVGPALQTVDRLNGIMGDTQGREEVSTEVFSASDVTASVSALVASSTSLSRTPGSSTATAVVATTGMATTDTSTVSQSSVEATQNTQQVTSTTALTTAASSSVAVATSQTTTSNAIRTCTLGLPSSFPLGFVMMALFILL